jgi:hypothetical protein
MKKRTTLYLDRNAAIIKVKPRGRSTYITNSTNSQKVSKIKMPKPFLHREQDSGLFLYIGKKIKIFLGDT